MAGDSRLGSPSGDRDQRKGVSRPDKAGRWSVLRSNKWKPSLETIPEHQEWTPEISNGGDHASTSHGESSRVSERSGTSGEETTKNRPSKQESIVEMSKRMQELINSGQKPDISKESLNLLKKI